MKPLTHVSLFTGSGIPCLIAHHTGFRTIAMCERDPWCNYALARLWPEAILFDDVRTADWSKITEPVTLLDAGVPCQPISTAGKQLGEKDERWLWPDTLRVVQQLRPAWCLFENPPNLRMHGLERIVMDLEAIGYECIPQGPDGSVTPLCIGAEHVGAPHKRHRMWLVCRRNVDDAPSPGTGQQPGNVHGRPAAEVRQRRGRGDGVDATGGGDQLAHAPQRGQRTDGGARRDAGYVDECDEGVGHAAHESVGWVRDLRGGGGGGEAPSGGTGADGTQGNGMGDPGDDRLQGERIRATRERERGGVGAGRAVAGTDHAGTDGLADPASLAGGSGNEEPGWRQSGGIAPRWPSRPGEPQHSWEYPRLVKFEVGSAADALARGLHASLAGIDDPVRARKVASQTNKAMLRCIGNGWIYDVPYLIYSWIAEQARQENDR